MTAQTRGSASEAELRAWVAQTRDLARRLPQIAETLADLADQVERLAPAPAAPDTDDGAASPPPPDDEEPRR